METTNSNNSSIKCRKCGGPHLTIKCGKEEVKEVIIENREYNNNRETKLESQEPLEQKLEPSLSNIVINNQVNIINYTNNN